MNEEIQKIRPELTPGEASRLYLLQLEIYNRPPQTLNQITYETKKA